jgi:hypothetical protein
MTQVSDNLVVNIDQFRSGRSPWVAGDWGTISWWEPKNGPVPPPMTDSSPVDPEYGKIHNNHYFEKDGEALFENYVKRDFRLTSAAAKKLGIQSIDMGKIGASRKVTATRVNDFKDPLKTVKFSADLQLRFPKGVAFSENMMQKDTRPSREQA